MSTRLNLPLPNLAAYRINGGPWFTEGVSGDGRQIDFPERSLQYGDKVDISWGGGDMVTSYWFTVDQVIGSRDRFRFTQPDTAECT